MNGGRLWETMRGLTPRHVAIILGSLTLLFPYAVMTRQDSDGRVFRIDVIAALWGVQVEASNMLFMPLNLGTVLIASPFFLFAAMVVLYCQGRFSWKAPIVCGAVSIALILLAALPSTIAVNEFGFPTYSGPLPIQIVAGLIFMRTPGAPPEYGPWVDTEDAGPWWEQRKSPP